MHVFLIVIIVCVTLGVFIAGLLALLRDYKKVQNRWFFAFSCFLTLWIPSNFVDKDYEKQVYTMHENATAIDLRITGLKSQIKQAVDKIKYLSSETAIKYMEEDIVKLEDEVKDLTFEREKAEPQKQAIDMDKSKTYVSYFLAHLEELLLNHSNPILQARYFGVIFNEAPTYDDILLGTPDCTRITGVNKIFVPKTIDAGHVARHSGLVRFILY